MMVMRMTGMTVIIFMNTMITAILQVSCGRGPTKYDSSQRPSPLAEQDCCKSILLHLLFLLLLSFIHHNQQHHHHHPHISIMILLMILISGSETPRRQDLHRTALEANPLHIPRVLLPIPHLCFALLKVNSLMVMRTWKILS